MKFEISQQQVMKILQLLNEAAVKGAVQLALELSQLKKIEEDKKE